MGVYPVVFYEFSEVVLRSGSSIACKPAEVGNTLSEVDVLSQLKYLS